MTRDFIFPDLGEGVTEGELVKWLIKEGDMVKADQDIAEVETDKALVNIPSPWSSRVQKLYYKEGDSIQVGSVMVSFEDDSPTEKTDPKKVVPHTTNARTSPLPPLATPHTRGIARQLGVVLDEVTGTGTHGRITEEDIRNFAKEGPTVSKRPSAANKKTKTDFSAHGEIEKIPLRGVRKKISDQMLLSQRSTATVSHMDEAEVDILLKIKKEKHQFAEKRGVKLTLLPFIMKACILALKDHPYLNASLDGEEIILKKFYHFGFAVDTSAGLMVPTIRDVDKKSIMHLATELQGLSDKARERSINLDELQGHSFSITNIGSIGGKMFTPIINYPDSAILGVGKVYEKAVVHKGKICVANVMPLCLSFDHRITDGATAAKFISEISRYLKDPDLLLLDDGEL